MDRARSGDAGAFAVLVARHRGAALRTTTLLGGGADAEDVVQEACLKAYRRLTEYRGDSSFRAWLLAIVANETRNLHRSRRRRDDLWRRAGTLAGVDGTGSDVTAGDLAGTAEQRRVLVQAVRELSRPDQQVVAYRFLLGLTEAETAAALDVPRGTVKSRTSRALARLRTRLGAAVLAVLAVALVLVLVPPARHALAHAVDGVLRFAGIRVSAGPVRLPASARPLPSTGPVSLDQARARARFPVAVPALLGAPTAVEIADPGPDGAPRLVSLFYPSGYASAGSTGGGSTNGPVRLDEFDGRLDGVFVKGTPGVQWVTVGGDVGLWLAQPHPLVYVDRAGVEHTETGRLSGPVLIWQHGEVSIRLEGVADLADALAIATSVPA